MKATLSVVLLATAVLLARAGAARGQEALVLSGGGARGLAQAGVFEGLEELGYDPDIVVGTSMGALVGALYAAGYGPAEIRERILAIDWNEMFTPTPAVVGPNRAVRYPLLNLDLGFGRFRVARGLIAQWRINRALAHLLFDANARARGDFDRLARRYRAVAADLKTGEAVVLEEGDLARAARASMAVPGLFAPVAWGDRVLVDGGIVDNLPTGVARRLGATRVVAVDVGRPTEEIHSLAPMQVVGRALDLIQQNTQRDPLPPDALVLPELDPNLGVTSFPEDPRPLFSLGLDAARRDLPRSPPAVGRGQRPLPTPPDSVYDLLIEAPDSALAALARRVFSGVVPGAYDPAAVLVAMDRLYTTGLLEGVWPRVIENPDTGRSAPVLLVRLDAPPGISLSAAAGYENDRGARAWMSLDRYTVVAHRPAVFSAAASMTGIERSLSLAGRVYMLNRQALAWSTGAYLMERDVRFFLGDAVRNADVLRAGGWLGFELPYILRDRVATAVVRAEWIEQEERLDGFSFGPLLRYTSADPDVLMVGAPLLAEAELRLGQVRYSRVAARASRGGSIGPLLLAAVGDLRVASGGAPEDVLPALGDDQAIPGLQWGEERGTATAVTGADAAYPFLGFVGRLRLRTGAVSEGIGGLDTASWLTGAQLAVIWRNPVAAAEWGFGFNTAGRRRFDISLGRRW